MTDEVVELCDKLVPLLREYDLAVTIEALSLQLAATVNLASGAKAPSESLILALENGEKRTFRINEAIRKVLEKLSGL